MTKISNILTIAALLLLGIFAIAFDKTQLSQMRQLNQSYAQKPIEVEYTATEITNNTKTPSDNSWIGTEKENTGYLKVSFSNLNLIKEKQISSATLELTSAENTNTEINTVIFGEVGSASILSENFVPYSDISTWNFDQRISLPNINSIVNEMKDSILQTNNFSLIIKGADSTPRHRLIKNMPESATLVIQYE